MRNNSFLITVLIFVAGCTADTFEDRSTYEPEPEQGPAPSQAAGSATVTSIEGALTHAAPGCDGAVVQTPRPGTQLTAESLGLPASVSAFYTEAANHHVTWLSTMDCTVTNRSHALLPATPHVGEVTNTSLQSSNWSGYQINQTAQYAQSGWTIPTVTKPFPGYSTSGYYSSTWSGIGGGFNSGSGALIQSGSTQDISSTGTTSYYFWYEIVGGTGDTGGEVRVSGLAAHPGDVAGSVAIWTPTGGAQMGVCNFTSNVCLSFTHSSSAPGISEEWIVEAPSAGGILPLANFGSVTFVNACWAPVYFQGASCSTISAGRPSAISLLQNVFGANQVLASPGPINATGNGFTVTYEQPERCPNC